MQGGDMPSLRHLYTLSTRVLGSRHSVEKRLRQATMCLGALRLQDAEEALEVRGLHARGLLRGPIRLHILLILRADHRLRRNFKFL